MKGVVAIIAALTMQALAGTPIQALVIALVSIALGLIHHAPRVVLSAAAALVPIVAMISLEGDIGRSERSLVAAAGSLINLALWF
ncbi:MAG: hypothetical protein N2483_09320, partial [Burkholderiaceae bacterium]|nr:hypothetical protein [Burkholderiaceae bacterium]